MQTDPSLEIWLTLAAICDCGRWEGRGHGAPPCRPCAGPAVISECYHYSQQRCGRNPNRRAHARINWPLSAAFLIRCRKCRYSADCRRRERPCPAISQSTWGRFSSPRASRLADVFLAFEFSFLIYIFEVTYVRPLGANSACQVRVQRLRDFIRQH